ncbi:class III lanthionine synthetase LanKC [Nonomuraea sp. K274]|uniref:Class III lanthionine synthetase LanKC n=1 Tax=Nonomuraea cypriaca TaxID=1187855 RepID=A0A931A4G8_9ACTN|nr:class III lanthionine synthetase LanKC [Nonomuraea cypriaca]MBF8184948.1 class III lanthionine synthetase LanKC [Nonomuraea cypriaca]
MDQRYDLYCARDPFFYERPESNVTLFPVLEEPATPAGWNRFVTSGWVHYSAPGVTIPRQGWKIHVSATMENAERVAAKVLGYCVERKIPVKVVPGPEPWRSRNAKYAERAGSGKLATVYPRDEQQLETILNELGDDLEGEPGPYILSDLKWHGGPLYVRYGAFQARRAWDESGREVQMIEDPHGNLVSDPRGPVFSTPEWVRLPDFLRPHLDRRNATRLDNFPYEIVTALHYSNGGGVYEAKDRQTGRRVVVKEGRSHAGVDRAGRDAVTRLRTERAALERMAGLPCVPKLIDYTAIGEHEFLIEEFVEGESLYKACGRRNPLIMGGDPSPDDFAAYGRWAMAIWQRVSDAVHSMHDQGMVFGDLHLFNILVGDDDQVRLIDFEGCSPAEERQGQVIANPGFAAPHGTTGTDIDEFALSCLKLAIFAPLTSLQLIDPGKPAHLARLVVERFAVPRDWLPQAGDGAGMLVGESGPELIRSSAATLLSTATPEREDRLFPGDVAQFLVSGAELGLAHGAAGVLWSLHQAGAGSFPEGERWILKRLRQERADLQPGFYSGEQGIAYALWDLGHRDEAMEIAVSSARNFDPEPLDSSLFMGVSGIGLNWLRLAGLTGDEGLMQRAIQAGEIVAGRLGPVESVPTISGQGHGFAGLMLGGSGPALLLTALYEVTGDMGCLDAAETALRQDLRRCTAASDGGLHVNEGGRTMPYLAEGSVGIGLALQRFLQHRDVPDLREPLSSIKHAATSSFCLFPGLFQGHAGLILFNALTGSSETARRQVRGLEWHATQWEGKVAFPGNQLLRLSMDLATGTAGVLLALAAIEGKGDPPVGLPFLCESFLPGNGQEDQEGLPTKERR